MAKTIGRLKKGDLLISGEIKERLPSVTNGLVTYYPFDGNEREGNPNLLMSSRVEYTGANEFLKYADIAPIIDQYGLRTYTISFEIKVAVAGSVQVYQQNGSGAKYSFSQNVNATTQFTRQSVTVTPVLSNSSLTESWLAFYGTYGTGRIITVKDIKIEIGDIQTAWSPHLTEQGLVSSRGCTFTYDGVYVSEGTTNISPYDGSFKTSSGRHVGDPALTNGTVTELGGGWRTATHYNDGVCEIVDGMTPMGEGKMLRWYHKEITGWKGATSTTGWSADATKTYTASIYVRFNKKSAIGMAGSYAFYGDVNNRYKFTWQKDPTQNPGEWIRGVATFKPTASQSGTVYLYGITDGEPGLVVDYTCFQVEEKPYATEYIQDFKSSGLMEIRLDPMPPWTVSFKHMAMNPLSSVVGQTTSPMILQFGNYYTNASISLWNYNKSLSCYIKGNAATGWTSTNTYYTYTDAEWDYKEHSYAIVAVNNRTFRVYMDGKYLGEQVSSEDVTAIMDFAMGRAYTSNAKYRDLSIYNRALSDKEIMKLHSPSLGLKKSGDMALKVQEQNPDVPLYSYYFPFRNNAVDINKGEKPVSEKNIVYEKGGAWIGKATTNFITNPTCAGVIPSLNNTTSYSRITATSHSDKLQLTTSNVASNTPGTYDNFMQLGSYTLNGLAAGKTYTFSAELYITDEVDLNRVEISIWQKTTNYQAYSQRMIYTTNYEDRRNEWVRSNITMTIDPAATEIFFRIELREAVDGRTIYVRNIQAEESANASPFVVGTRGAGELILPKKILDNVADYAISVWVHHSGSLRKDGPYAGEHHFIIDGHYNGGLTLERDSWTTSMELVNVIYRYNGGGTTNTNHILQSNEWNHIAVTRTGGEWVLYFNGERVIGSSATTAAVTDPGIYIGSGRDTWANHLNGYVRDLIIQTGTVTIDRDWVAKVGKVTNPLKVQKGIAKIPGIMKEGQVL